MIQIKSMFNKNIYAIFYSDIPLLDKANQYDTKKTFYVYFERIRTCYKYVILLIRVVIYGIIKMYAGRLLVSWIQTAVCAYLYSGSYWDMNGNHKNCCAS